METEKLSDHPTSKGSHKCVDKQHTIRFALELKESNDKYFPEFSFRELLRSAVPKVGEATERNDIPANEDGEHGKLQALAKKFEEKYGPKQKHKKKRRERIEDLVDVTYGYDETDPFVDNSEAYDELIPVDWTTEHGGFYINQGGLNFKPVTSDESDDDDFKGKKRKTPKKLKDPNKVKKIKESGEKEKKRKHLTPTDKEKKPRKIRLLSGDKEKKIKKKISLSGSSSAVTSSGPLLIKLISTNTTSSLSTTTKTATTQATVSPTGSSISLASSLMSLATNNVTPGPSAECSPQTLEKTNVKTEQQESSVMKNTTPNLSTLASELPSNVSGMSNSAPIINQNGLQSGEGVGEDSSFVPKLPQYLPLSVEACVQKLKKAADNAVDEGKCKFFNKDVNQLLLETETKSRELSCRVRSGIYDYLAFYLPCTKETLLKRAKKLLLTDQAGRLREPMAKLKAAVDKAMPEQIKRFEEEVRLHVEEQSKQNEAKADIIDKSPEDKKKELFKTAMEVDDDGEKTDEVTTPTDPSAQATLEEKTKKASLPRRKFVWTDELRELLSDVVTVRVKLYEMSKTRTTSAEEYLKEFFETEVKTLWPKGWMTSRILFRESKSVHTRVTSALFKPKKVPGPKKQGESLSPSDAMDTSSQNADSLPRDNGKAAPDTSSSVNTSMTNPAVTSVPQPATVIPMMAAVKIEQITENTSTAASATTNIIKTIPKLNPSALSVLKAKLIINNPGVANKANFVMQPGNKVVSATILKTKPSTAMTTALSTSAQASMVASAAKALAAMVTTTEKSSVPMVTTTKLPASVVSSVSQALGITKGPLSVGSVSTKPSVSMVTTSPSVVSMVSTSNLLTLNKMGVESRGAVTKGENTMEGRSEAKAGVTMATNVTTNGMERQQQQQQAKFPVSMSSSLSKSSVSEQRLSQPVSTAVALSAFNTSATPANSSTIKSQPVTILDFADMVSADSQNDAQEILSNQLQPQPQPQPQPQSQPQPQLQPQQPFINKSPSPQKPKEPTMPMMPKASVVSPPRQQNTAYSATSPSSMIRSPTKMTQTRNNMPPSSAALADMLMSCNMVSANMANMQNKYIDLNAAALMAQRQQAANNKTLLDSISAPTRMPMDMHTVSVPLTHPVISHQLSNQTQSASAYLPTNIQPTLSMLGHANLQGKATNPLSHIGVVPQSVQSSMMHMNRPLQQQQQQQQQQSNMVMTPTPNPFNQDPNHNPNGGHPSSSFMPRFS